MSTREKIKIGHLIRDEVESRGMKVAHFAKLINRTRQNVHNIFGRQTIDTELLYEISKALDRDFFTEYSALLATDSVANTKEGKAATAYAEESEGVHIHIHLPESGLSEDESSKIIGQIRDELSSLSNKKGG